MNFLGLFDTYGITGVAIFLAAIIFALTIHEFAHAWVASRQGDQTARMVGRVSLNPLKHLDPAGSLMFLFVGIGWGKPVPVNSLNLRQGRLGDFYVSIAGIVANLIAAFILALPLRIITLFGGDPVTAVDNSFWLQALDWFIWVNIFLAAFNILPLPPLDGSKAVGILVPRRFRAAYYEYLRIGPVLLVALLLSTFVFNTSILWNAIDYIAGLFSYFVKAFPSGLV